MNLTSDPEQNQSNKGLFFFIDRWVLLAVILTSGTMALLSVLRYTSYNAGMLDVGNMSQAIWSATQGRLLLYTREGGVFSRLSWHVEMIYFLLAPFYAILPSPITLLIIQACLFGAGAFPLFAFALRRLENISAARLVTWIYLLYPVAQTAVLFDFHGDTLAMPLLMFMLDALDRRAWRSYALWLALALSCKFYVAATVVVLGIVLYLKKDRRVALWTLLAGLAWGSLAFLLRPVFAPPGAIEVQATTSGYLSFYFGQMQRLLNPTTISQRFLTALVVFMPALWLGWRDFIWLAPAGVIALPSLLSVGSVTASDYRFHHYAITVPFLLTAIVYGAAALRQRQRNTDLHQRVRRPWRAELYMTLGITLLFTITLVDMPLNPLFWIASPGWGWDERAYGRTPRDALKDRWLHEYVPKRAPVATSMFIAPHIVNREVLYLFEYVDSTHLQPMSDRLAAVDYAIADALFDFSIPLPGVSADVQTGVPPISAIVGVGHQPSSIGGVRHDDAAIAALLHDPAFGLVEARDGLLLFQRAPDLQDVLPQRVSVQKNTILTGTLYNFENGIGLRSLQVTPIGERRLQLHCVWEVLPEWEPGRSLLAVSRLEETAQMRIVHLPTQTLYPTPTWSPGEIIIEDFEIVLPTELKAGQYPVWTAWYDSRHLFAAATDARSRVGAERQVTFITINE
ncbi:MAG TPA: DUF2079 domain-containing protein [Anaerolineae bacterium]|nr:DUF2079 domain-containing protein [Anaerolineae bacterium]